MRGGLAEMVELIKENSAPILMRNSVVQINLNTVTHSYSKYSRKDFARSELRCPNDFNLAQV